MSEQSLRWGNYSSQPKDKEEKERKKWASSCQRCHCEGVKRPKQTHRWGGIIAKCRMEIENENEERSNKRVRGGDL